MSEKSDKQQRIAQQRAARRKAKKQRKREPVAAGWQPSQAHTARILEQTMAVFRAGGSAETILERLVAVALEDSVPESERRTGCVKPDRVFPSPGGVA